MITLFLSDGLGNQMFQYAFARSLQLQTKNKLQFSLTAFNNDDLRCYALNNLNIPEAMKIVSPKKGELLFWEHRIFNRVRFWKNSNPSGKYIGRHLINAFVADVYSYDDITKKHFCKNISVYGQFQNVKYFEQNADIIREELKVKVLPSEENQVLLEEIDGTNSVCVHIRRGDYLNPRWVYLNICNYEYYKKAMQKVCEKTENPIFYIFSNTHEDIEWIKENYDFSDFNVKYVDLNNPDYEELRLMYSCKHFIISNSTFSWWAQYLGEYDKKIVVAPSKWNNKDNVDDSGIYMSEWEVLEV
ncbi:MAG: alpha-1,2-fucosyltransferase [Clostridia bacterium]|nr:alpha-1,2-fucosyltransferase [Clostridia bacterium]